MEISRLRTDVGGGVDLGGFSSSVATPSVERGTYLGRSSSQLIGTLRTNDVCPFGDVTAYLFDQFFEVLMNARSSWVHLGTPKFRPP